MIHINECRRSGLGWSDVTFLGNAIHGTLVTVGQVLHPRSVSDYNATEAAEISSACASGGRAAGRCHRASQAAPKLNTQKRL